MSGAHQDACTCMHAECVECNGGPILEMHILNDVDRANWKAERARLEAQLAEARALVHEGHALVVSADALKMKAEQERDALAERVKLADALAAAVNRRQRFMYPDEAMLALSAYYAHEKSKGGG